MRIKPLGYLLVGLLGFATSVAASPTEAIPQTPIPTDDQAAMRAQMRVVYDAFRQLQPYLYRREAFLDRNNEHTISQLLSQLDSGFHRQGMEGTRYVDEPGFLATLQIMNAMVDDAALRFREGRKGYALWRLKTSSNYCVACHTRFQVNVDFFDTTASLPGLDAYERGEFFLATRQFDRATEAFLNAALNPTERFQRMDALRKWLIIYVRVHPDPIGAIRELERIMARVQLPEFERLELMSWVESLKSWRAEPPFDGNALEQSEALIRAAVRVSDPLVARRGTVELLRATALLHKLLDSGVKLAPQDEATTLYLLGYAYSLLPQFFVNELPEAFLERCIRQHPHTEQARQSYALLRDQIVMGYTGSAGTQLPAEISAQLKELHDLAYGVPVFKGRV